MRIVLWETLISLLDIDFATDCTVLEAKCVIELKLGRLLEVQFF